MMREMNGGNMMHAASAETCPFAQTVDMVKERWTLLVILEALTNNATTFKDFLRIPELTPEALSKRLDLLVTAGVFVERHDDLDFDQPNARYDMTEAGMQLVIILRALGNWADTFAVKEG